MARNWFRQFGAKVSELWPSSDKLRPPPKSCVSQNFMPTTYTVVAVAIAIALAIYPYSKYYQILYTQF